ncbi:hypothetical protein B2I21_17825 [Chryseobacterium mucoviscidosis]|uniref:hypothetical protein n=1 Tax=unclassified Paenibacillus TaxID=185978 RepID=UPI0009A4651D|nr:hypothetical protein [Paenibacillus sp. 11B]MDN8592942.1 hypothetical protein [Paenibacillus sp. 11B]OPG96917.1 hypothetical protein B2I21_17825 [Chryseobacterium mucoviscidosis]
MPTTKKEHIIFGLMMCTGMVVVMMFFNLWHSGLLGKMSPLEILFQFVLCFIIAFLVESFIVGPVARKIAFSLPFDKSNKILGILAMSFFMVIGMVLMMSIYGMISASLENQLSGASIWSTYLHTIARNFSLALPYQLIILGPLVRYVFRFIKGKGNVVPSNVGK